MSRNLRSACESTLRIPSTNHRSNFHITLLHVKINQHNDDLIRPPPTPSFFVLQHKGKTSKNRQVHGSAEEIYNIMAALLYLVFALGLYPKDKDINRALDKAFNAEDKFDKAKGEGRYDEAMAMYKKFEV